MSSQITAEGSALANARVHLVRPGQDGLSKTEVLGFEQADEEGRVSFRLAADESPAAVVSGEGQEAMAFPVVLDVPDRVELQPGLSISGRVVNDAGEPVAADLYGRSFIRDGHGLAQLQRGRAGADGRFRLAGVATGDITLRAVAEGYPGLEFARRLKLEDSVHLGDLVLGELEVVWVRTVDARFGTPVQGALIRGADGGEARTGTEGLTEIELRFGRELQVLVVGYEFALHRIPAGVGTGPDHPFVIELEPALAVTGVLVAGDGLTPARQGRFTARSVDNGFLSGTVQQDGTFYVDLPAGGVWELELSAGNVGSARVEVAGTGGEVVDLGVVRASASSVIAGYVVGEDLEPLAGVAVSSTPPSEVGPLLAPFLGGTLTVTSGPEGYFELYGLEPGPGSLRLAAEGYAPLRLDIYVEAAEHMSVGTIELSRGRRIVVRSDTERGLVELTVGGGALAETMTATLSRREALFRTVPEGPLAVVVLNGKGQPICMKQIPDRAGDLAVRCDDRSVPVTGRVTMSGTPVAGTLLWQRRSGEVEVPGGLLRSRTGGLERVDAIVSKHLRDLRTPLGEDGTYRIASVVPGRWEVLWVSVDGGAQEPRVVDVPAGARREVVRDIAYDGVSVHGTVLDPEGRPAARATVEALPDRSLVMSDSQGNFRMLGLRPGRYDVRARHQNLFSDLVEVELERPGDQASVHLHLVDASAADRLRIDLRGARAGFCYVEADDVMGGLLVQVRNGTAEVPLDALLGERVRAACNTDGRWTLGGWQDIGRALESGLSLDPDASTGSLVLIGRLRAADVSISAPGGWDLGQLRMWFGGASTFSAGETIPNLPIGSYVIRWGGRSRTVTTDVRRATQVDLDG